jgi:hypothetical protein
MLRVLRHREAPSTELPQGALLDISWEQLSPQAQFLIDFEFLTQHTKPPEGNVGMTEVACVYTRCPPYLPQIACQFPWVHFYGFQFRCPEEEGEYDPEHPGVRRTSLMTLHTEHNRTISPFELTKETAVTLSKARDARPEHRLVMICHNESETRQAVLHAMLRADHSLLDLRGTIPRDYLDGQIVLPMLLAKNALFACLVAPQSCHWAVYDQKLYEQEMGELLSLTFCTRSHAVTHTCTYTGFFQTTIRASEYYDQESKDFIISEYARRFQRYHRAHPDAIRSQLKWLVDGLV